MAIKAKLASIIAIAAIAFSGSANAEKQDFHGTWKGTMSGMSVQIMIWAYGATNEMEDTNAAIWVDNVVEALPVLGYKGTVDAMYFFRKADKAPIAMYRENGVMYLEYWEAKRTSAVANSTEFNGTPARKIVLTKSN